MLVPPFQLPLLMTKNRHVCLIEDDEVQKFLIEKHLGLTGIVDISVYRNGKEAFDSLLDVMSRGIQFPDLILLDLNMPIWSGWDFLDEFDKLIDLRLMNIYILTSSLSQEDLRKATHYGLGENYLLKPIQVDQLRKIIDKL